jgi:hypothetical protein
MRVLPDEPPGMETEHVHSDLPEEGRPSQGAVSRALGNGIGNGWTRAGRGVKNDPYRYWRVKLL